MTNRSIERRSILIVDDNVDAADMLAVGLDAVGYTTMIAHDAVAALALAVECRPFAVCLDIGLPSMDGCELARRLRALPGWEAVRLIAITGYAQSTDRERTREAGIEHHLVKPVSLATIRKILDE